MPTISLTPTDTWFFRDGRPYNSEESSQTGVTSLFPPNPPTVVGAVRVALALQNGWNGQGSWPESVTRHLGDGENLGPLRFQGPFLRLEGEILYPMPLSYLVHMEKGVIRLVPGEPVACDLADSVRLPVPEKAIDGHQDASGYYVTVTDLDRLLRGSEWEQVKPIHQKALWSHEPRVGIRRERDTRTTGQGALYSPLHVRLRKGVDLVVSVEGTPGDWAFSRMVPLGGESRQAHVDVLDTRIRVPCVRPRPSGGICRFTVTLLTPGDWEQATALAPLPGLGWAQVVSACVGRPVRIGGWDGLRRRPLPMRPHFPAGSTWFLQAPEAEFGQWSDTHLGKRTEFGFGQIAVGVW